MAPQPRRNGQRLWGSSSSASPLAPAATLWSTGLLEGFHAPPRGGGPRGSAKEPRELELPLGPLPGLSIPCLPPSLQTLTLSPSMSFPHPEFPYTPSPPEHGRRAGPVPTAIIGGVAGSILLVVIVVGGIVVALRRRRHTFKGDYSTKKHVYGNGYSKAGIPQHHPPMAQNLQYPDDSDDEKKPGPLGGSSYEEEEEEEGGGGGERKVGGPHPKYDEDAKRPYFTVDEAEARQDGYGDRTLGYQYDPEQLDLAENMVSQNDGSFISKKEWYV